MSLRINHAYRIVACIIAVLYLGGALAMAQSAAPSRGKATQSAQLQQVNINQASADQLTALRGVGPATAKRILDFRQKNGPFKKVEDLLAVRGIGEKTLERMKSQIVL